MIIKCKDFVTHPKNSETQGIRIAEKDNNGSHFVGGDHCIQYWDPPIAIYTWKILFAMIWIR